MCSKTNKPTSFLSTKESPWPWSWGFLKDKLEVLGPWRQVFVQVKLNAPLWQFSRLFEHFWPRMLIITGTPICINLIISTMPTGFDCLHLFWPLVSQVVEQFLWAFSNVGFATPISYIYMWCELIIKIVRQYGKNSITCCAPIMLRTGTQKSNITHSLWVFVPHIAAVSSHLWKCCSTNI